MAYRKPPFDTTRYYIPPQNPDAYGLDVNYVIPSYTSNIPREDFDTFNQYHYDYLQNPITLPIPDDEVVPDYQILEDESLNKFRDVTPDKTTDGNRSKFNFGKFNWKGVGDLASTATEHIMDVLNNSKSTISIPKYTNYHTTSLNSLDDVYGMQNAQYLDKSILHKPTANDFGFDWIRKAAEGAAAGSSFGPWGALAGAIGGAGAAVANAFVKKNTYKNDLSAITNFNRIEKGLRNYAYNQGLNNTIKNRDLSMNIQRSLNSHAVGGPLGSEEQAGVTTFNTGGTHEMNPNGGIPQGIGDNGQPNVVEQGEVKWNDFIFSNRIQPNDDILSKYNTAFNKQFNSYADAANFILDLHKERENNPFDKSTLNVQMQRLADAQEYQKLSDEAAQYGLTPEEYVEYQQQVQNLNNQNMNTNTFASGGDKGNKPIIMGTMELARNSYVPGTNGDGYYLRLPGIGTDGAGLKGPTRQTRRFAYQFPRLAEHLSTFIREDYLLQRIGNNVANSTDEYARMAEMQRYEKQKQRYDIALQQATHIISFLHAYGKKFKDNKPLSEALNYLKTYGKHWSEDDYNKLRLMLDNWNVTMYYFNKPASLLNAKLSNKDSFNRRDPDIFGNHPEFHLFTVSDLPTVTTRSINNTTSQTNTARTTTNTTTPNVNNTTMRNSVNSQRSNNNSSYVKYYNPQLQNSNGTLGAYNTTGDGYKITGTGGGSGNKQYRGDIDYNDPANKPYEEIIYALTDDDWNNIKQNLADANSYYADMPINQIKKLAHDGQFGPVHEAVSNYIKPTDNSISQIVQDQLNDDTQEEPDATAVESDVDSDVDTESTTNTDTDETLSPNDRWKALFPLALRTAPIANNIRQILEQNAPDYTYSDQIKSLYRPETYRPVGQYQRFQPVDQHYLDTQANQQLNTMYGFYRNNTQSNAASNLFATMAATMGSRAANQAYLTALQQNNQNRNTAIAANNQLDLQNEANRLNVQRANRSNYANIMGNAYTAAEQERLAVENARETNMQNLAMNLGDLGRELYDRWRIAKDPTNAYDADFNYQSRIPYFWNPTKKQFEPAE